MYTVLDSDSTEIFAPSIPNAIYYPTAKTLISTDSTKGKRLIEKKEKCTLAPGKIFNPKTTHCIDAESSLGRNVALKQNHASSIESYTDFSEVTPDTSR